MYYRVAMQAGPSPTLRWQSTALGSLNTLMQWLQFYSAIPRERLRVFSSASRAELDEQFRRESQGLASTSLPVMHLWPATRVAPDAGRREVVRLSSGENGTRAPGTVASTSAQLWRSPLDVRREELEHGSGGDHNLPYRFGLPTSTRERLAWVRLLVRVRQGDLQADVLSMSGIVAVERGGSDAYAADWLVAGAHLRS